jgi:hypothetical protein
VRPAAAAGICCWLFTTCQRRSCKLVRGQFHLIDRNVVVAVALLSVMWVPSCRLGDYLAACRRSA